MTATFISAGRVCDVTPSHYPIVFDIALKHARAARTLINGSTSIGAVCLLHFVHKYTQTYSKRPVGSTIARTSTRATTWDQNVNHHKI